MPQSSAASFASLAAACAARVMACVVRLPPEMQVQGKSLLVSPQVSSTFSQGTPSSSAETRWTSDTDSLPKFPMPDCT